MAWGIYRWITLGVSADSHYGSPKWRLIAAQFGFLLAGASSLTALAVYTYTRLTFTMTHHDLPYWDPVLFHSANLGFLAAIFTLALAAIGAGALRVPTALMAAATGFVWFVEIVTR